MTERLDVSRALKNPGQIYPFQAELDLPEMEVLSDPVRFDGIAVEGEFMGSGDDRVSLKAAVSAQVVTRCARCLEGMRAPVNADIEAVFSRQPDPDDPDLYVFEASVVDLTDAVRDALVLELPLQFLCRPDCRGLCPVCGANLNRDACSCRKGDEIPNPFSALKSIVFNDEEV